MTTDRLTQKGLFERLVRLESKLDMKTANDLIVAKRFKSFSIIFIFVEVINVLLNVFLFFHYH